MSSRCSDEDQVEFITSLKAAFPDDNTSVDGAVSPCLYLECTDVEGSNVTEI